VRLGWCNRLKAERGRRLLAALENWSLDLLWMLDLGSWPFGFGLECEKDRRLRFAIKSRAFVM